MANLLNEVSAIWKSSLEYFKEEMTAPTIDLWFGELEVVGFEDFTLTLQTKSSLKFDIIQEKYMELMEKSCSKAFGFPIKVKLTLKEEPPAVLATDLGKSAQELKDEENKRKYNEWQDQYTFENFVVGASNKFAYSACYSVAEHPAENWNPLFIYGNSGLGKTHLLHACIHRMREKHPDLVVMYAKGDEFTNEMVENIKNNTMDAFRRKYRQGDVLLIDDIQFIAGKQAVQEEFFHTFNALHEEKKQIILTCDCPPRNISLLQDRLQTRFEWGLLADIQVPDLELRQAIINKKLETVNLVLTAQVSSYLAENLRFNVRQIEGAIKKLAAMSYLTDGKVTMDMAKSCVKEMTGGQPKGEDLINRIFKAVEEKTGITRADITSDKRVKKITNARHLAVYLLKDLTEMSYPEIGNLICRDHSTIISSIHNMEAKLKDPSELSIYNDMKDDILSV